MRPSFWILGIAFVSWLLCSRAAMAQTQRYDSVIWQSIVTSAQSECMRWAQRNAAAKDVKLDSVEVTLQPNHFIAICVTSTDGVRHRAPFDFTSNLGAFTASAAQKMESITVSNADPRIPTVADAICANTIGGGHMKTVKPISADLYMLSCSTKPESTNPSPRPIGWQDFDLIVRYKP